MAWKDARTSKPSFTHGTSIIQVSDGKNTGTGFYFKKFFAHDADFGEVLYWDYIQFNEVPTELFKEIAA